MIGEKQDSFRGCCGMDGSSQRQSELNFNSNGAPKVISHDCNFSTEPLSRILIVVEVLPSYLDTTPMYQYSALGIQTMLTRGNAVI